MGAGQGEPNPSFLQLTSASGDNKGQPGWSSSPLQVSSSELTRPWRGGRERAKWKVFLTQSLQLGPQPQGPPLCCSGQFTPLENSF